MPVTTIRMMLIFAIGVKRFAISFISLPTIGGDSRAVFDPGNITKRVIKIPPIHTTVPIKWIKWIKWLNASTHRFILHLRSESSVDRPKRTGIFLNTPIPLGSANKSSTYLDLDFLASSFLSLAGFSLAGFRGTQPQPQMVFFSVILITSFIVKRLSNNLINTVKKIAYFFVASNSFTLCRTVVSSFLSSSSYFLRDSKFDLSESDSRKLPVPWHPHVQTSVKICRQFSIAFSSIEYGIQYPFLSLLTSPACFNILRCWDTAAVVMPIVAEISLAPKGPWPLSSSIIFTRVSTLSTLNISEGSVFIGHHFIIKQLSNGLIIKLRFGHVKLFLKRNS